MNEDEVIEGVENYLKAKLGRRYQNGTDNKASAKNHERGPDLKIHAVSNGIISNRYYIEAKGELNAVDNSGKKSNFLTEFRWAISQIVLQMKEYSAATIYGIAIPESQKDKCLRLMKESKGLKLLKVRLYLAYRKDDGTLFAKELTVRKIYK